MALHAGIQAGGVSVTIRLGVTYPERIGRFSLAPIAVVDRAG